MGNDEHVSAHDRRLDGSEVAWHDAGDGIAKALTVRRRLGVGAAPGLDPLRPPARIGGDLVEPAEVAVVSLVERGEALGDQSGLPERIENKPAAHDGPRQRSR